MDSSINIMSGSQYIKKRRFCAENNISPEDDNEIRRFNEGKIRHEERKERLRKDRK